MDISCPKCGSHDLYGGKKGFSGKKAVAGAILTGGIGLLAGTLGSNKVKITCLKCGNIFSPGQKSLIVKQYPPMAPIIVTPLQRKMAKVIVYGAKIIGAILLFSLIAYLFMKK